MLHHGAYYGRTYRRVKSIGNPKPLFTRAHPPEPPSTPPATIPRHWEPPPAAPERQRGSLAGRQQAAGGRREYRSRPPDDCSSERRENGSVMWKYVLGWVPMVFIAIINGAIREGWYGKHVSELQAHQVSTATGVLLFGVYIWALIRLWRPASAGQALTIGLVWLGMTVAFEFLFAPTR